MIWTEERVDLLKKLYAENWSASQIAKELNCGFTRNAIVGKIHRLAIKAGDRPAPRPAVRKLRPPSPGRPRAPVLVNRGGAGFQTVMRPIAEPPQEEAPIIIPFGQRCGLLDLSADKCRWPVGDPGTPDFFFCGGSPYDQLPYCHYHCRVAYQPVQPRRRSAAWRPRV